MNGPPSRIALGFDFDHTLGLDHALEHKAFFRYGTALGASMDLQDAPTNAAIEETLVAIRAGETTIDRAIPAFYARRGCEATGDGWRRTCYALVEELVVPVAGARELLDGLRRDQIPFAILTNGWSPLQEMKIAHALGADAAPSILVSETLGVCKPDRRAFDALVAALGVGRENVWFVGDNPEADVAGALAAGLRAVWLAAPGDRYPERLAPPTLTVHALGELENLVQNTIVP